MQWEGASAEAPFLLSSAPAHGEAFRRARAFAGWPHPARRGRCCGCTWKFIIQNNAEPLPSQLQHPRCIPKYSANHLIY